MFIADVKIGGIGGTIPLIPPIPRFITAHSATAQILPGLTFRFLFEQVFLVLLRSNDRTHRQ